MATSDHLDRPVQATDSCPECSGSLQAGDVETVCEACGLVVEEHRIDNGPEWRSLSRTEEDPKRTGAPLTPRRHDRGLSTKIGRGTDAHGNSLSGRKRRQLGRLRREQKRGRWRSKAERNLAHGLGETQRVASAVELPGSIRDQACQLFRSAVDEDLLPGRSIEAFAAASVHAACRCNGLPRKLSEIVEVAAVGRGRIENSYRVMNRELGIPAVPPSPKEFIPRIVSELDLSDGTRRLAEELVDKAVEAGIAQGRKPTGLAAGSVYTAATSRCEGATQEALAECVEVSVPTLRKRWEELRPMLDGGEP